MANSTQYNLAVAGYLFNTVTGHPNTIETLLAGTDKSIWMKLLANEIGQCSVRFIKCRNLSKQIKKATT